MTELERFRQVLVFAAHPDDEVIGCGATIRRLAHGGAAVTVVVATSGDTGRSRAFQDVADLPRLRRRESTAGQRSLGVRDAVFLDHPTQALTNDRATFQQWVELIRRVRPDLVLSHGPWDKHRDHRTVSELTKEAVWKAWEPSMPELGPAHRTAEAWMYEITDPIPRPDVIVDITSDLDAKLEALASHVTQSEILGDIAGFLRGLASLRGYAIGKPYGEAFRSFLVLPRAL